MQFLPHQLTKKGEQPLSFGVFEPLHQATSRGQPRGRPQQRQTALLARPAEGVAPTSGGFPLGGVQYPAFYRKLRRR